MQDSITLEKQAGIGHNSAISLESIMAAVIELNKQFDKAKKDKETRATEAMTLMQMVWQYSKDKNDLSAIRSFCAECKEFGKHAARIFNAVYESHMVSVEKGKFFLLKVLDSNGKPLHKKLKYDADSWDAVMDFNGRIDKCISDLDLEPTQQLTENQLINAAKERAKKDALNIQKGKIPVNVYLMELHDQLKALGMV